MAELDYDRQGSRLERALIANALDNYFARTRSEVALEADSPAFDNMLAEPGAPAQSVNRRAPPG